MHIPAMDSLRHERVGIMQNEAASMVVKAYVKTEDTSEMGAHEPIESMSRPFPMMIRATSPTIIESFINRCNLEPISDDLIEYISLIHESIVEQEWKDELDEYDEDSFSESEDILATTFLNLASSEIPQNLWRTVFRNSTKMLDDTDNYIHENPLQDIRGRDRCRFSYIPSVGDVDEWSIFRYFHKFKDEDGNEILSESIWLRYRYNRNEYWEERPLISYQNQNSGYSVASPDCEFGIDDVDEISTEFVASLLDGTSDSNLNSFNSENLQGTRTEEYLKKFIQR